MLADIEYSELAELHNRIRTLKADLTMERAEKANLLQIIKDADTDRTQIGSPVVYGEFDEELNYIPPTELPNIPAIMREQDRLRHEVERLKNETAELTRTRKALEGLKVEVGNMITKLRRLGTWDWKSSVQAQSYLERYTKELRTTLNRAE